MKGNDDQHFYERENTWGKGTKYQREWENKPYPATLPPKKINLYSKKISFIENTFQRWKNMAIILTFAIITISTSITIDLSPMCQALC